MRQDIFENARGFGDRLRKARKDKNLSQEQLSQLIGISRQAIYEYENNLCFPRIDNVIKISKALDIDLKYLCLGKTQKPTFDYGITYKDAMKIILAFQDADLIEHFIEVKDGKKRIVITSEDEYIISLEEQIKSIMSIKGSLNQETFQRSLQEILDSYDIAIMHKK